MDQSPAAAAPLTTLARLRIDGQIMKLARERMDMKPSMSLYAFHMARIGGQLVALLRERGTDLRGPARERQAFAKDEPAEVPAEPRKPTDQFYEFNPNRKHSERKKDNAAALGLLRAIDAGEVDAANLTDEQKQALAKYSGTGGNLIGADGKAGSAYEYYTPKPIASGMWELLAELGFKGGKVGDPCAGVGIFGATAPANVAMETVELNETSGRINQLVNGGPSYSATVSPFEAVASRTSDEIWDAVITNVPFGGVHDRGSNRKIDPKYQDQPLETYFILRSLEKLRHGGLAAFITPPRVVSAKSGREEQLRIAASYMAEFMGAYRLPNSVFGTADADTITDVIVFRKFSREATRKIEELREQNPAALIAANVLWTEFTEGRYFAGEGRRFVLGEFVAKDPNKFRDVDRVVSDQSIANIAKMMRKFPGSRIDWKALEATETEPIIYNEGDCLTMAGQTLKLQDGAWVPVASNLTDNEAFDAYGPLLSTPLAAVSARVTWEQASGFLQYLRERSRDMEVHVWLRLAANDVQRQPAGEQARLWDALITGMATVDVMQEHAADPTFNYLEEFAVLSDMLQSTSQTTAKAPASFSRESKAAFTKARITYSRKTGYSALWKGEGQADVAMGAMDEESKVRALQYKVGRALPLADLKTVYGEDFDVMAADDWCLDASGEKAMRADDYYVGKYADYLRRIDAEIAQASGPLREKLLRQRAQAEERLDTVDPQNIKFNLFSPFVTMEERAEFMRRFMHPAFAVGVNNLGNPYIVYEGPSGKNASIEENLMSRMAVYVAGNAGGTGARGLSLATKDLGSLSKRDGLRKLNEYATRLNTQFDGWAKANPMIMARMKATAEDPERLYFREVDDTSPLQIEGMNPALKLHGYQNSFVRQQARSFGGINGYDVGLGKTFTALACAQYVHSIGVKKKTMFVVPNAVLSNWRREVSRAYLNMDDCLFIGLEVNPKTLAAKVNSSNYARDFTSVLENRHRKIFCTLEAFAAIPMKDETLSRYEDYLLAVDPSYLPSDTNKKADFERADSKLAEVTGGAGTKSSAYPYFEDMGIDSLVVDEGHMFKNSKDTLDFSGARFLSVAEASQRGRDMQMKAWYVRGLTGDKGEGVLPLTATPITNSPLEIYSMLTLAVGERKVHDLLMGIKGADAFMNAMCMIEEDEDEGIDGTVKSYRIFTGLQNVSLLRNAIGSVATIKTARDVAAGGDDLKLPDAPENNSAVQLGAETMDRLKKYQMAYRAAKEATGQARKDAEPATEEEIAALEEVQARLGEDAELIAHPFNLIQKMTALIADPELDERATFYTILASQRTVAEGVIAAFNKLGRIEKRARGGPWTDTDAVIGQTTVSDGGDESVVFKIKARAKFTPDGRIVVDTTNFKIQQDFEKLADKAKLDLDCTIPPKLAALLENVKAEEANPRSKSGRTKQLVFCDHLSMHNKIRRVLSRHAGIPMAAIEIISGQSISNPEQMQDIQDGFNAEGADNRFRAIIANEKAEVGINLQKGTQAIHHFTIGWTPDSQHQRNGRGVRQGNTTGYVNVYHYDADGTFDKYKRQLTDKKADWIGAVMDKQGGNEVKVAGGLAADDYDDLINSAGDDAKMQAIADRAALRERLHRAESARMRQVISLQTAKSQLAFVKQFKSIKEWAMSQAAIAFALDEKITEMRQRDTSRMKPENAERFDEKIAEMAAKLDGILRMLDDAGDYQNNYQSSANSMSAALKGRLGWKDNNKARQEAFVNIARSISNVNEDSDLYADWESQVAQATAMAEQSYKEFIRIAENDEGAHSARMLAAFKDSEEGGQIIDGKPLVGGMFVRTAEGALMMVEQGGTYVVRFPNIRMKSVDVIGKGEIIGFESSAYAAAVAEAAALDDAVEAIDVHQSEMLFGAINPDVARARKNVTLVKYSLSDGVKLPSPHFAYPIPDADGAGEAAGLSPLMLQLIAQQKQVITKWEGRYMFIPSTVDVTTDRQSYYGGETKRVEALVQYAKGHGQKMTTSDFALASQGEITRSTFMKSRLSPEFEFPADAPARLEAATSQEELDTIAATVLAEGAPWLEVPADWTLTAIAYNASDDGVSNAYHRTKVRLQREAEARERANNPAPVVEPAPVAVAVETKDDAATVNGVVVSAAGKIGLTGETMSRVSIGGETKSVKDYIKQASQDIGEKAFWVGAKLQWEVTPKAWAVLCDKYPEAAKLVHVVPAVK